MKRLKVVLLKPKESNPLYTEVPINEIDSVQDSYFNVVECSVLDYIDFAHRLELVQKISKKIRIGGEFFIEGLDYDAFVLSLKKNLLDIEEVNDLVYGGGRLSIDCLKNIIEQCTNANIDIKNVGYKNEFYWLRGYRC